MAELYQMVTIGLLAGAAGRQRTKRLSRDFSSGVHAAFVEVWLMVALAAALPFIGLG
ncbi:hypothetical protein [Mesorhizobium sp.]|uniref:hypothetical protein n=1 Tax=Mesorhizobium sp. TaxID=1871066 RepID=UPI0025ECB20A|nr:hypothetical protein [Mesorhizobium sp.]